jgi:predicted dehydrogenase
MLIAACRIGQRVTAVAGAVPACARTVRRLLRAGRIGTVIHVSCIDRSASRSLDAAGPEYVQLLAYGADHLAWIRDLLGVEPVKVLARCGRVPWRPEQHGSLTEAFLEMANGVHVQYHGSLASNLDHHQLWIDGERGVLRTDGRLVWFRKAGWPRFVPVAGSLGRRADSSSSPAARAAARLERLASIRRGTATVASRDDRLPLALAEAVMRADRSGRPVTMAPSAAAISDDPAS